MTDYYRFNPKRSKKAVDRLNKLADFLDTIPRNKFDLGVIVRNANCNTRTEEGNECPFSDRQLINEVKEGSCGTAACAIGWCPTVFPGLFRWVVQRDYGDVDIVVEHKASGETDFEAAEAAFELDEDESRYLFGTEDYVNGERTTAKTVAKRIREFIKIGMPEDAVGY